MRGHRTCGQSWVFLLAAAIGVVVVLAAGRRGAAQRDSYPWLLDETAKLHVGIVGALAGFAFTGIVLVVTLTPDRSGAGPGSLDTVIVMFLVAYLFWVGAAFLISYIPHVDTSGDFVQRIHMTLATTLEYRTVFISWFALLPLLQANGLDRLAPVLYFFLPVSPLVGSVVVAIAADGLGLLRVRETYFSAIVGTGLALAYTATVAFAIPSARSPYSSCISRLSSPASTARASRSRRSRRSHRDMPVSNAFSNNMAGLIVIADMQLTMLSLAFLWLAVVGAI